MRLTNLIFSVVLVGAFATLCALGFWQVKRLQWKESLIEMVDQRSRELPQSIDEVIDLWNVSRDVEYLPVKLSGVYRHQYEMYYYNTLKGVVGWNVITPLTLEDGRVALVNRGFVPDAFRYPETRNSGQLSVVQKITGLARNPVNKKPNYFVPENDLSEKTFYWKNYSQMISKIGRAHV